MTRTTIILWVSSLLCAAPAFAQVDEPGLDTRPANATCLAPPRPTGTAGVAAAEAFPAAPAFFQPVKLLQPPGDATRWFVLEKAGRIKLLNVANPAGAGVWLDLTDRVDPAGEGGLLGIAFDPAFPVTPHIYVSYTGPGAPLTSIVSRIILDNVTSPQNITEQILLTVDQPYDNHNGGDIAFGPDRYLYFGLGDGGSGGDPDNHAQDNTDLLGAMLRIDVLGVPFAERYRIPPGNPFVANPKCGPAANAAACPEIYAWGFRNPWRWSFDQQSGTLWMGDVGQGAWEEVDIVERGGNYGWRCREGAHDYSTSGCPTGGLIDPVAEYGRGVGTTITGGFVYRGTAIPSRQGQYIFGDYSSDWVAALRDDGSGGLVREELFNGYSMATFGQDQAGEIYFAGYTDGRIRKLVPAGGPPVNPIPANLADTGCVNPASPALPASGLVPYDVNAPFWSDEGVKARWMALPDGTTIAIDSAGDWTFPPRSVLMKNFRLNGRLVETRLLMRHPDGVWAGYTYEWNDAQTAATRVVGGKTRQVEGQSWVYPSESQCRQCHTPAAGFSLGPETAQLNRDFLYPSTGRTANQLTTLSHIGMFGSPLPAAATLPRLANPLDSAQVVHGRARAYLHTNCAQCHRPGGPTPVAMDLRNATALQDMEVCDIGPSAGDLGIAGARIVALADAAHSVLTARAGRRDANGMPPLGSNLVDAQGVALLTAWINGLGSCNDADNDQVDDARDNCIYVGNTDQRDTNGDGYGNICDADLNDTGLTTVVDFNLLRSVINQPSTASALAAAADINGSGIVTSVDFNLMRSRLNQSPGPSALAP